MFCKAFECSYHVNLPQGDASPFSDTLCSGTLHFLPESTFWFVVWCILIRLPIKSEKLYHFPFVIRRRHSVHLFYDLMTYCLIEIDIKVYLGGRNCSAYTSEILGNQTHLPKFSTFSVTSYLQKFLIYYILHRSLKR